MPIGSVWDKTLVPFLCHLHEQTRTRITSLWSISFHACHTFLSRRCMFLEALLFVLEIHRCYCTNDSFSLVKYICCSRVMCFQIISLCMICLHSLYTSNCQLLLLKDKELELQNKHCFRLCPSVSSEFYSCLLFLFCIRQGSYLQQIFLGSRTFR